MECKFCGAQLEEGATFCLTCGKELNAEEVQMEETAAFAEDTCDAVEENAEIDAENTADAEEVVVPAAEAPVEEKTTENKPGGWKTFLIAFCGAIAGIVLVLAVLYASGAIFNGSDATPEVSEPAANPETTSPTAGAVDATAGATDPTITLEPSGKNDILNKLSYTVADDQADQWKDLVVATVGDMELTNAELQLHYWSYVIDFLNNYSYYLSYMGLDYTQPLDQQMSMENNMTWQHFFLESALLTWHKYAALEQYGAADGFQLAEESQALLDSLPEHLESMLADSNYESAEELLKADMGALCTLDGYYSYMNTYYKALEYFDTIYAGLVPTDDEVLKFFNENQESFESSGVTMESGNYYDVRHILIEPQGGTTDESGNTTYTDEQWEACRAEAQAVLDQWAAEDGTEEGFAALAAQLSTDGGSASNGGLYTDLTTETSFVTEFKDWYLDASRQVGDTGLVKSVYGYHIMYFSGSREIWYYEAATAVQQDKANQIVSSMMEGMPMVVEYEKIGLGNVKLG